jgi:hypothetical protein
VSSEMGRPLHYTIDHRNRFSARNELARLCQVVLRTAPGELLSTDGIDVHVADLREGETYHTSPLRQALVDLGGCRTALVSDCARTR